MIKPDFEYSKHKKPLNIIGGIWIAFILWRVFMIWSFADFSAAFPTLFLGTLVFIAFYFSTRKFRFKTSEDFEKFKEYKRKAREQAEKSLALMKQASNYSASVKKKDEPIKCPKCGSNQFHAGKKGFGIGKAIAGSMITFGVGAVAGLAGSNTIMLTCLNCGKQWKAGKK